MAVNSSNFSLCEFSRFNEPCWGEGHTFKRYGKSGRDKDKLTEVFFTCTGHRDAGAQDKQGPYTKADPEVAVFWGKEK